MVTLLLNFVMSTFLTRIKSALQVLADSDITVQKGGVAVQQGPTGLVVKTNDGTWTLAFYPNPHVKEALSKLNGVQVTCMYSPGSNGRRLTP
jgi:hypothetical protein